MSDNEYGADNIQELEGLEAVRKRPGMYIGSTSKKGLHHMVQEVVDNSVDEAMTGNASRVGVTIAEDGGVIVEDDGRGIPVEDKDGEPAVNVIMTSIHAGGKFDSDAYEMSGGLHGVGVSVVNALSERLVTEIKRDGHLWRQEFEDGVPQGLEKVRPMEKSESTGTMIKFWSDPNAFETTEYDYSVLRSRLENLAYLNPGIKFSIEDRRSDGEEDTFLFERGISEFVEHLNEGREEINPDVIRMEDEKRTDRGEKVAVDIAVQYTNSTDTSLYSFANNIETAEGGTHETGFKTSLTRVINSYAEDNDMLSRINGERLGGDLVREGLTSVVSVKHSEPQFEGQTKTKLGNSDARGVVSRVVTEGLSRYLEEHPDIAESIVEKAVEAYKAKKAARKAEELERKSATGSTRLPGKLADCQKGTSPENAELFVVEGDSAGGCFTGDTEIALASGRSITFEQLVQEHKNGETHYCYTVDDSSHIQLEKITNPRRTKENAELVRVTLDNGEKIECTPDHQFMLRGGQYREAQNLEVEDSLMPLYRKKSDTNHKGITIDGYEMVKQPVMNSFWVSTHLLADKYNVQNDLYEDLEGDHKHHINFDKQNNRPDNIERLDKDEHIEKTLHTDEVQEKMPESVQSYNHRVAQVEELDSTADVYDLEVPETHNFALESGVFVHNSAKQARNPENQAILPLRGKILNVEKNKLPRILEHDQIRNLITALGTGIDDEFDIEDLRYKTVIMFTDADVDGAHIKTLLLTFIFRHMPELIENGHVYSAKPPLYRIRNKGNTYDAMTDEEREEIIEQKCGGNPTNVQRFKGLGEMNPQQLWDTTMNPENRRLERIEVEDAVKADRIFSILMGSKVEPRRDFIRDNADEADWIDI